MLKLRVWGLHWATPGLESEGRWPPRGDMRICQAPPPRPEGGWVLSLLFLGLVSGPFHCPALVRPQARADSVDPNWSFPGDMCPTSLCCPTPALVTRSDGSRPRPCGASRSRLDLRHCHGSPSAEGAAPVAQHRGAGRGADAPENAGGEGAMAASAEPGPVDGLGRGSPACGSPARPTLSLPLLFELPALGVRALARGPVQRPLVGVGGLPAHGACVHLLDGAAPGHETARASTGAGASRPGVSQRCRDAERCRGVAGTFQVPAPGDSGTSEGRSAWEGTPRSCQPLARAPRTCRAAAAPLQGGKPGLRARGHVPGPPAGAALPLLDRPPGKFQAWPAARGAGRLRLSAGSCHERLSLGRAGPEVALNPCGASAAPRALPPLSTSLRPQLCDPG